MAKLKITISLLLLIFCNYIGYSQPTDINEYKAMSSEIFSFITTINDNIDSFFDKEKAKKAHRNLGYFQNDLEKYLVKRKKLMDYLNENNYTVDTIETNRIVSKLKKKLNKLSTRLAKIIPYINSEMSYRAKSIVAKINRVQELNQVLYVSELEKLLSGEDVDIEKLQNDGLIIYSELSNSLTLISEVRESLKKVYKN